MENVFKNKNFVLLFLGALVSNIGNIFCSFAISYWILDITNNNAVIQGAYLGVCGISYLVFSLFGGVLSDRFNKAKLLYLCDYAKAIVVAACALVILLNKENNTLNVIMLFIGGILSNFIAAIFSPASASILPLLVKEEQLQQANSYYSILSSLQSIIGICLAAIMYSLIPITTLFFIVAVCYFLSAVSEMFIKYQHKISENKLTLKTTFEDIKEGFVYIKTKKALLAFLPVLILLNFFITPVAQNFISYFVMTDVASNPNYLFHEVINPEMWGSLFSVAVSIATIIFSIVVSTKQVNKNTGRNVSIWLVVLGLLISVMAVSYFVFVDLNDLLNVFLVIFVSIGFLLGMNLSFVNIPMMTVIQIITDKDKLGKVSSITDLVSQGLVPISTLIAGFVIQYLGSSAILLVSAAGLLVVAVVALAKKSLYNFH